MPTIRRSLLALPVLAAPVMAACGGGEPAASGGAAEVSGQVTVFAAASLTDAFEDLAVAFAAEHPDVSLRFSFAASSQLVTQIREGAPADVLASADQATMADLVDAGATAGDPVVFATNRLAIAVPPGNPDGITGVGDLAHPDLVVVTCAEQVPCGSYAAALFREAGLAVTPRSFEENVRAVLSKVALGEADAGIVYATDVVAAAGGVEGVATPDDLDVVAEYPVVVTGAAPNPDGAAAFVRFLLGAEGQAILGEAGFGPP